MDFKNLKKWLIYALFIDSAWVFVLQYRRVNAWAFICLYWAILTIKNGLDAKTCG